MRWTSLRRPRVRNGQLRGNGDGFDPDQEGFGQDEGTPEKTTGRSLAYQAIDTFDRNQVSVDYVHDPVRAYAQPVIVTPVNTPGGQGSSARLATAALMACIPSWSARYRRANARARETIRSSLMPAEQFGHGLLVGDRAGTARGHPLPVVRQRSFYLGLLQDPSGGVALDCLQPPQFRQRNDRGGLPAKVDHLVRLAVALIIGRKRTHTATVYPTRRSGTATRQHSRMSQAAEDARSADPEKTCHDHLPSHPVSPLGKATLNALDPVC